MTTASVAAEPAAKRLLWHSEEIERFTQGVLPILEKMGIWISPHKRGWSW
jgi:hypothetical protein